jgi:hypothetical protein
VREQPRNPIEYFAQWLIEYNNVQKKAKDNTVKGKEVAKLKDNYGFILREQEVERNEKEKKEAKKTSDNTKFWADLEASEDPMDNLGAFAEYLHANVGSTGVYIGQLEPPHKPIEEDGEEDAHLDLNNPAIIKFKFANKDHKELLLGSSLKPGQGKAHDAFNETVTSENETLEELEKDSDDVVIDKFKHLYVPEVVRDPKMHYWKVPRLGSYMAIPLVYQSCLSVDAFTKAVEDQQEY